MFSLYDIRAWDGSQHRAWEELAFQVRMPVAGEPIETRKTRAPDGGVEWYHVFADGHEEGFQAKFYSDLASAIGDMGKSVRAVATQRPRMSKLTFVVPFDFTDQPSGRAKADQARWEDAIVRWIAEIPGADRLSFEAIRGGQVLAELTRDQHAGRRAFWFGDAGLTFEWLDRRWAEARRIVGERYTPEAHTPVSLDYDISAVSLADSFNADLDSLIDLACGELVGVDAESDSEPSELLDGARSIREAISVARKDYPAFDPQRLGDAVDDTLRATQSQMKSETDSGRRSRLDHAVGRLFELQSTARSVAAQAARRRALAIVGPAGQGKTHSMLQAARERLDAGAPSLVLLGQRFADGPWWTSVSSQLGGVTITAETFLQAFDSMSEASGVRGLIVIDALNESQRPETWRSELESLLAYVSELRWTSLVVTWRDDYSQAIAASTDLPVSRHSGLAGHETDALHRYCELFGVRAPEAVSLEPAFSNPLFLRMYCDLLANGRTDQSGRLDKTQVFRLFAELRSSEVLERLGLRPGATEVRDSIDLMADALIASGGVGLPREEIESAIDALLPSRTDWPNTLFSVMSSAGLLETTPSWDGRELVSFPFQAFSEHLVVSRLLQGKDSDDEGMPASTLEAIRSRRRFWSAAAVQVPERFGVELVDLLESDEDRWAITDATLRSLVDRSPSAFGSRAVELLDEAFSRIALSASVRDAVLELAPRPGHPGNARWLHDRLRTIAMPDRDAQWSIGMFEALNRSAPFNRLLDWAYRRDVGITSDQVVLAALPLAWSLTSPNRFLRDHATKALVELFFGRLTTLAELLSLFDSVDDPYVLERLLTVAYGSIMRSGDLDLVGSSALAVEVGRWFDEGIVPVDALARDSALGIVNWAVDRQLVAAAALQSASPPYGSSGPDDPPSADFLKSNFGYTDSEPRDWRAFSILDSCLDWMGDFHKYVIDGDVGHFSLHPLAGPPPTLRKHDDPAGEVDVEWAGRWVAWRAISLGWTSERFDDFERSTDLSHARDAHKAERFGKKYQWMALHELLARLADNFHPAVDWDDESHPYAGPWPWFGRDIDPSLATPRARTGHASSSVALIDGVADWVPHGPDMEVDQEPLVWAGDVSHFPEVEGLARLSVDGDDWVALYRHSEWRRRARGRQPWSWDRQQWLLQFSWLARAGTGEEVFRLLSTESLFGRWMPERHRPHRAYLGEGPWSHLDRAEVPTWLPASRHFDREGAVDVLPASEMYVWEGNTLDCSIDESLSFQVPVAPLLGDASWQGTEAAWLSDGKIVAQALRTPEALIEHSILMVDADWLSMRLVALDLELVVGVLGERQSTGSGDDDELRAWTELTSVGWLRPGSDWEFAGPSVNVRHRT